MNENVIKEKTKIFMFETPVEEQNKTMGLTNEDNNAPFPIGILYLDAILKKNNYEVLTKDYTMWEEQNSLKEIQKEIENFKPDIIGITVMSMTRVSTYKAIKLIKKINKKIKIILGGMHSSMMYAQLLENFPIEAICIGDSEESLLELLEALKNNKSLKKIKGIAYKDKDKIIVTKKRELNKNLDDLPFPSYEVFMNKNIKTIQITTSRGCPNKCSFCCLDITSRRIWRPRSYKNVVDEIEYISKKFPWVDTIQLLDDTFTLDNQRVIDMCKEIIKRNIKLKFYGQGRIKPVSTEMIYWMEKAGFIQIYFGIETGSAKLLKSIHKNITKEDCIETFKKFQKFKKISLEKCLIVGFPGETKETVNETIKFVKELQKFCIMDFFYAAPLWIYPGTEIYQLTVSKGKINDDYWLTDKPCPFFTLEHSEKWLMKMSNKIVIETMLSRGKIYFLKELIKKISYSPKHYLKRFLKITQEKELN